MPIMEVSETLEHRLKTVLAVLPNLNATEQSAVTAALVANGDRAHQLEWIAQNLQYVADERHKLHERYQELLAQFRNEVTTVAKAVE